MPFTSRLAGIFLAVLLWGTAGSAHHYGLSAYDASKPTRVTGVLAKVEWTNPHAKLHVDVKAASGAMERWIAETGSPGTLVRHGIDRNRLKIGDALTLSGFQARDGSRAMILRSLVLADGTLIEQLSQPQTARAK